MPPTAAAGATSTVLWDRWREHARATPEAAAIIHWTAGEEPYRWRWGKLLDASCRLAALLRDRGVEKGEVCALIFRHHRDFYPLYLAVSNLGALPAVLAYPNSRLHPDKFRQGLIGMSQHSGLDWLLTERELESTLRPLVAADASTIRGMMFPLETEDIASLPKGESRWEDCPAKVTNPEAPCLLQHSSGTTGLQKAVMLSHRAVLTHVSNYGNTIGLNNNDKVVSWLPLYHDMGLIAAFHLPLAFGIPTVQLSPFEWVMAPVLLLDAIAKEKATLAWQPNFAYNLMADRIHEEDLEGIRLDSLRLLINCSEPVRGESQDAFARRFASYGLKRHVLTACYAMAETTFAVTQTPPGNEAQQLPAARDELTRGNFRAPEPGENSRTCVSSGPPIAGCRLKVVAENGAELSAGQIGEIVIESASLFDGYRTNPAKTAEVLKGRWFHSGDFGFCHEGEYYIIGRKKDIIIIAGKNIYPEDVEDAISGVEGVLPGRVIAFGLEDRAAGTEQVCIIAETECPESAQKQLRRAIVEAGMVVDVTITRTYLVPPRWLIKSSAGKPSRTANKERALAAFEAS